MSRRASAVLVTASVGVLLGLPLLSACGVGQPSPAEVRQQPPSGYINVFTVEVEGRQVPCVSWKLFNAGGLSCDWSTPSP